MFMKSKNILIWNLFIIILLFFNFSCQKFVDIRRSSGQNLIETAEDCQLLLDNYTNLNTGYCSDGEVSTDDYYLNNDGYLSTYITDEDRDLYVWTPSAIRKLAQPQWQEPYQVVYLSNLVMENVEKLKGKTDQVTLDGLRGASLFFRAYAFWQVAQLYAKPYNSSTSSQDFGIPIRLNSDVNGKSVRGTVEQTYNQIVADLKESVGLLSTTSSVASRPNKVSAYAMLARVYLSMENYPEALNNASLALQVNNKLIDYNTLDTNSVTPFIRFNKEVIFQSLMNPGLTLDPGPQSNYIAKIDTILVQSYDSNDLRKRVFFELNSSDGSYSFTGNYEPSYTSSFFNGLAVDELYLIRAECYARAGNVSFAMLDLNTLLRSRWLIGKYKEFTSASVDDALSKILIERRKELVMRGQRWTDLRRLNRDSRFAKTLTRNINGVTYALPPNDLRYTLLIPDEVIINSQLEQNIR